MLPSRASASAGRRASLPSSPRSWGRAWSRPPGRRSDSLSSRPTSASSPGRPSPSSRGRARDYPFATAFSYCLTPAGPPSSLFLSCVPTAAAGRTSRPSLPRCLDWTRPRGPGRRWSAPSGPPASAPPPGRPSPSPSEAWVCPRAASPSWALWCPRAVPLSGSGRGPHAAVYGDTLPSSPRLVLCARPRPLSVVVALPFLAFPDSG